MHGKGCSDFTRPGSSATWLGQGLQLGSDLGFVLPSRADEPDAEALHAGRLYSTGSFFTWVHNEVSVGITKHNTSQKPFLYTRWKKLIIY